MLRFPAIMSESKQMTVFRAFLVTLPLHRPIPVGAAMWSKRPVVLLRGEDSDGQVAWGEAAPLDGYGPDGIDDVLAALSAPGWEKEAMPPSLACAVGTIRMGLLTPGGARPAPPPDVSTLTSAVLDPDNDLTIASHVKIKVGRDDVSREAERILAIAGKHPHLRIRLDANGLLTREAAMQLVDALGEVRTRIDYFEEPWEGCFHEDMRGVLPFRVAIDESLDGDNWRNADVCVIKPSLMGDPAVTLDFAKGIQSSGRRVSVSSAFESRIGMTLITWLAARIGDAAPGLGTYRFIADDWGGRPSCWDTPTIDLDELPAGVPSLESVDRLPFRASSGLTVEEVTA